MARVLALETAYRNQQLARDRDTVIAAVKRGEIRDPLDRYRAILGEAGSAWLERRAHHHAQALDAELKQADPTGRDHDKLLWSKLREASGAFAELDQEAAAELLEIEGERRRLKSEFDFDEPGVADELARLNTATSG